VFVGARRSFWHELGQTWISNLHIKRANLPINAPIYYSQTFFTGLSANNKFSSTCGVLDGSSGLSQGGCNEQRRVATGQSVVAVRVAVDHGGFGLAV
jgi:hypothetical protein